MTGARRIRLMDHRGRDATVWLVPATIVSPRRFLDSMGRPVSSARRIRAIGETCSESLSAHWPDPERLARELIDGDPEVDVEIAGRATGPCERVHLDGDGNAIHCPVAMDSIRDVNGLEIERRPVETRPSTLAAPPTWSGAYLPRGEFVRRYATTRVFGVRHGNALEYDFLYGIAEHLDERNAVVRAGSGRRGAGPVVVERNGPPYFGFLDGRVRGDAMRLVLHLAAFALATDGEEST